jgi:hypothetical protein
LIGSESRLILIVGQENDKGCRIFNIIKKGIINLAEDDTGIVVDIIYDPLTDLLEVLTT